MTVEQIIDDFTKAFNEGLFAPPKLENYIRQGLSVSVALYYCFDGADGQHYRNEIVLPKFVPVDVIPHLAERLKRDFAMQFAKAGGYKRKCETCESYNRFYRSRGIPW